jgi:hypothetical protein
MCKHVAAVLYGIGARLDRQLELLFELNQVDETKLIAKAGDGLRLSAKTPDAGKRLEGEDLAAVFGLEIARATKFALRLVCDIGVPPQFCCNRQSMPELSQRCLEALTSATLCSKGLALCSAYRDKAARWVFVAAGRNSPGVAPLLMVGHLRDSNENRQQNRGRTDIGAVVGIQSGIQLQKIDHHAKIRE